MRHKILAGLAVAGALSPGHRRLRRLSSSRHGSHDSADRQDRWSSRAPRSSPMTDTFNPFSSTSTGYLTNAVALYNEPLFIFNTLNSAQAPIPMLATGYSLVQRRARR